MRRHTGQRALYEAWSLSRSKPKRHGLLERLRPQLEKLQALANAVGAAPRGSAAPNPGRALVTVSPVQSTAERAVAGQRAPRSAPQAREAESAPHAATQTQRSLGEAGPLKAEAPLATALVTAERAVAGRPGPTVAVPGKTEVRSGTSKHGEVPPLMRGQARPREGGALGKPKVKSAPHKPSDQVRRFSEGAATKAEVLKVEPPEAAVTKVESSKTDFVEPPEVEAPKAERPPEDREVRANDHSPLPASSVESRTEAAGRASSHDIGAGSEDSSRQPATTRPQAVPGSVPEPDARPALRHPSSEPALGSDFGRPSRAHGLNEEPQSSEAQARREAVKSAPHELSDQSRRFTEAGPRKPIERPISSPAAGAGPSSKIARIVERLSSRLSLRAAGKILRAPRNEPAGLGKDAKPRLAANLRPRPVQLNAGRIEVSLPYRYGIVVGLVTIIVLLTVFKLGQVSGRLQQGDLQGRVTMTATNPVGSAVVSQGNNMIVIAQHKDRRQLEPLGKYFNANGISTLIVSFERLRIHFRDNNLNMDAAPKGDGYLLLAYSEPLYNNPDTPGTDGYKAKQKIIELGDKYKPEPGFASFSAESFRSAYGLKMQ